MSSALHPLADLQPHSQHPFLSSIPVAAHLTPQRSPGAIRRRLDKENGRALEQIGHAIEYLMDGGVSGEGHGAELPTAEAIRILSKASRDVFACCPEVLPSNRTRLSRWFQRRLTSSPNRSVA